MANGRRRRRRPTRYVQPSNRASCRVTRCPTHDATHCCHRAPWGSSRPNQRPAGKDLATNRSRSRFGPPTPSRHSPEGSVRSRCERRCAHAHQTWANTPARRVTSAERSCSPMSDALTRIGTSPWCTRRKPAPRALPAIHRLTSSSSRSRAVNARPSITRTGSAGSVISRRRTPGPVARMANDSMPGKAVVSSWAALTATIRTNQRSNRASRSAPRTWSASEATDNDRRSSHANA